MKKLFILFVTVGFAQVAMAQKFGYVNSQELLVALPEVAKADASLDSMQTQLVTKGQDMMKEFETQYKAYMEDSQKGLLSNVQKQKKEEELTQKQQGLQAYEQEVQGKLALRREQLYKPILDKVSDSIKAYGKEMGYTMIFDTSAGMLLYSIEADNLLPALKTKLVIK
jgi:outer membrane protein